MQYASGSNAMAHLTLMSTEKGVGLFSKSITEDPAWAHKVNSMIFAGKPIASESVSDKDGFALKAIGAFSAGAGTFERARIALH